jgi:hypothetical protein
MFVYEGVLRGLFLFKSWNIYWKWRPASSVCNESANCGPSHCAETSCGVGGFIMKQTWILVPLHVTDDRPVWLALRRQTTEMEERDCFLYKNRERLVHHFVGNEDKSVWIYTSIDSYFHAYICHWRILQYGDHCAAIPLNWTKLLYFCCTFLVRKPLLCCTAVQSNIICTVQIASHQCCTAIQCNITCTVQIASHQCCIAVQCNITCTVQIASHQCWTAL